MIDQKKRLWMRIFVLLVVFLFINLPIINALEISNVRVEVISHTEAAVKWQTDEPADSFVSYGLSKENAKTVGDASAVTQHQMSVSDLTPETTYYYKVKSGDKVNDNEGSLYSFSTPVPDTTPPEIKVDIPAAVKGNSVDISGTTEAGAKVNLYVNGPLLRSATAAMFLVLDPVVLKQAQAGAAAEQSEQKLPGKFTFADIPLENNKANVVKIEAVDKFGNNISVQGTIFADTSKPKVELGVLPSTISERKITLKGTISENSSYEVFVQNRSIAKGQGMILQAEVQLEEGENKIKIILTDQAGWVTEEELSIISDTKNPTIEFEFSKGKEYYQGRAETDITGTTEPGAEVYLFVFRPLSYEFNPKFDKAWEKVTADAEGRFVFEEVNLESQPIRLEDITLREIPSGLSAETIFPIEQIQAAQKFTYHVYLIAQDKSGKAGFAKKLVTVNTCFSSDFDFEVQSLARFQAPLRLNPTLLDDGREEVTAVFNLSYRGRGVSADGKNAFEIQNVQFDKACTQGMLEDESTKVGCNVFPNQPKPIPNADKTAWYLRAPLFTTEKFSEKKEDFWNEFRKRQIVFPMKVKITYRENLGQGKMSELKTQVSCQELGYFIDIPVDSKNMLPDFLAEEGLDAIDFTIDKIDIVMPYLEKAILVTGVAWIASFLGKLATRYARIVSEKLEFFFTKGKEKDKKCPSPIEQNKYYLESEIKHWQELKAKGLVLEGEGSLRKGWEDPEKSLDKLCPTTAGLWKTEAVLDQAYRWTGDRVLCRTVPAGWTATKEKNEVDTVIASQNQCTASSRGVPLLPIENCGKRIEENINIANPTAKAAKYIKQGEFTCYQRGTSLYTVKPEDKENAYSSEGRILKLEQVHNFGLSLQQAEAYVGEGDLFAYKPYGGDQFIIAQDKSCSQVCRNPRRSGYRADTKSGITNIASNGKQGNFGCFEEHIDEFGKTKLIGQGGIQLGTKRFDAGYTNDCFVNVETGTDGTLKQKVSKDTTGLLSCVCALDEEGPRIVQARTAMKEQNGVAEEWFYHQATVFKESNSRLGTYYPEWRYYKGRDFSSAFGADYLLDYFHTKKEVHQVSPNTQFLGAYQTVCLSQIHAHLTILKSILMGLRNCIQEAKVTGLRDAGVCKTIFTQQVCGLVYKAISYFFNQCSPYSFGDEEKGVLGGVGEVADATFGSIGEAMQSSIDDVKSDYGNAQLNNYFATGAQGLTQSMCMAAFGYDWPLGTDFILDAAYAVPGKSTVLVIPANRELSTFDPSTGNAVYNYEIGAMILPGCKIKSYNVYLKCVGPEDNIGGRPNVVCGGDQPCDCQYATEVSSILEGDKRSPLDGGRGFEGLKTNTFFSPPIPSPQRVNKPFRYDHVVVELQLDQSEKGNEEKCFDAGYTDGKFYFPIVDVSPPGVGVCKVQPLTGKYYCPEFVSLFGGGQGAYLQDPFISCYDTDPQSWVSCNTPNIFTKGEEIKVRANAVTDGNKYCVKMSTSGLSQQFVETRQLPVNIPGNSPVEISLGTVEKELFSGASTTVVLSAAQSAQGCSQPLLGGSASVNVESQLLPFQYQSSGSNYIVTVPPGVQVVNTPYDLAGNVLRKNSVQELTSLDIQQAVFSYNGFQFKNVVGSPQIGAGQCVYQIRQAAGPQYPQNEKTISVTADLLLPDAIGNCYNAEQRVKTSIGKPSYTQPITLRLEPLVSQVASQMHKDFLGGNYQKVIGTAGEIAKRRAADIEEVAALYYSVAARIAWSGKDWKIAVRPDVCNIIEVFRNRKALGQTLNPYPEDVKNSAEYKKVDIYFTEIEKEAQCGVLNA